MRNTNKKGFTIVELVIVVAVIAILAAVLIPTFSGIIRKANESKDTQLVKHLNTAIAADVNGDKTMSAAIAAAAEFGFDLSKIDAKVEGNEILWDSVANVFCYLNNGKVEYIGEVANKGTGAQLWIIDTDGNTETHPTYSSYVANVEAGKTVEAKNSIDVTACDDVNVLYTGAETANIYTNGSDVEINAPQATVHHYGDAGRVHVVSINTASYHVYGNVGNIIVDAGHIVAESGANVNILVVNGNATATAVKEDAVSMVYNNGTGSIEGFAATSVQEPVDYAEDGTFDTNKKALMISTKEALINALNGTTDISAYDRLVLTADLSWDMTVKTFETVIVAKTTLDLNGHSVTVNATERNAGSYGPFNVQSEEFVIMDSRGNGFIKGTAPEGDAAFDLFFVGGTKSGKLVLNSGSLIMENDDGISYTVDVNTNGTNVISEFVMNGGTVEGLETVRLWQKNTGAKATVTINSGYLYGDIYFMGGNNEMGEQLTINGGTIVAAKPIRSSYATYAFAKWGNACKITLNGGTFVNQPNAFTGSSISYNNIIGTSYDYTATDLTGWTAEKIFNIVDNR